MLGPLGPRDVFPRKPASPASHTQNFRVGTTVWEAPRYGYYEFVLRGAGGKGYTPGSGSTYYGGGSGAYARRRVWLNKGAQVTVVVKAQSVGAAEACTMTFPDGRVMSCGCGGNGTNAAAGAGGVASGGDTNLNGSAGGAGATTPTGDGVAGLGDGGGAGGQANASNNWGGGAGAPGEIAYPGDPGGTSVGVGADLHCGYGAGGAAFNASPGMSNRGGDGRGSVVALA